VIEFIHIRRFLDTELKKVHILNDMNIHYSYRDIFGTNSLYHFRLKTIVMGYAYSVTTVYGYIIYP